MTGCVNEPDITGFISCLGMLGSIECYIKLFFVCFSEDGGEGAENGGKFRS